MNASIETNPADKLGNSEMKTPGIARDFAKNVKEYSSGAMESISDGYDSAVAWVKKNPLQAAAVGAGVGFLLGAIIRRMGSEK
jgi:ElaB/YqjD/DUF883 family membrane-anchored ribosome-binding protein